MHNSTVPGSPVAVVATAMNGVQTRAALESYLVALTAREEIAPFFSDDVLLTLVDIGQEV